MTQRSARFSMAASASSGTAIAEVQAEQGAGVQGTAGSVGTGTILALIAQVAVALGSAILGVVVGRLLGPAGTGSFNVALSMLLGLGAFFSFGIGQGVTYYVSRGQWHARDALGAAQVAALGLGLIGVLVGVAVAAWNPGGIFRGASLLVFALAAAALPFWLSQTYCASIALALGRYGVYAAAVLGQVCATLFAVAGLAAAFDVVGAIAGVLLAQLAAALGLLAWWRRRLGGGERRRTIRPPSELVRAVRFGFTPYLANALQYVILRADIFILNGVASSAAVGHYSVAVSVMMLGLLLPTALATATMPRVAALDVYATPRDRLTLSVKSVRHALLALPVTCVALSVALFTVPLLYGTDFAPAIELGFVLLPGTLAYGIGSVLTSNIVGKGQPAYALYAAALVTPPTLVLYLLLIPSLEGVGAALASTVSYVAMMTLLLIFFRRATGIARLGELVPTRADLVDYRTFAASALARAHSRRHETAAG